MSDDGDRLQLWVHPHAQFAGGEFDLRTTRTGLGGPWQERVEHTLATFEGDSVAVVNTKEVEEPGREFGFDEGSRRDAGESAEGDPDPEDLTPRISGDHTYRPYGTDWDRIVEDRDHGDVDPERIEGLIDGYDEVVVRGGYYGKCEQSFVENLASVAGDRRVVVDAANSYYRVGPSIGRALDGPEAERLRWERRMGDPRTPASEGLADDAEIPESDQSIVERITTQVRNLGVEVDETGESVDRDTSSLDR